MLRTEHPARPTPPWAVLVIVIAGVAAGWTAVGSAWWNVAVYAHELGHVAVAEALGGDARHFVVHNGTGGFAPISGLDGWRLNVALAAGYLSSALLGAACLWGSVAVRTGRAVFSTAAVAGALALMWLPPWRVNNADGATSTGWYTWAVAVAVAAALAGLAAVPSVPARRGALAFGAGLGLAEFTRAMWAFLAGRYDGVATDVTTLAELNGWGPRWVAAAIAVQGALVIAAGVGLFVRGFIGLRRAARDGGGGGRERIDDPVPANVR